MSLPTVIQLAALMEILEGLSGHGLLRTKRMCLHFHPNILLDALPQLSCHPHPPPTHQ